MDVPELDLTDLAVLGDLAGAFAAAREQAPLARLLVPGFPMWAVTRHEPARAMLGDPRFEPTSQSYQRPPVPDDCLPYLRSLTELDGTEHTRLRRLVSPAFTPRRAARFRPRIERVVTGLLDRAQAADGPVDLVAALARPLPMAVMCELVGIPEAHRSRWEGYGAAIAAGDIAAFTEALPGVVADSRAAVEQRRVEPADDLLTDLVRLPAEDGDRLDDVEIVGLVWQLVLGGQTPTNLLANGVAELLRHPEQLAALRRGLEQGTDPMPAAVEELLRWCGPQLLTVPRFAREDAELAGVPIAAGEAVTVSMPAVNRDPRVFTDPDRFDVARPPGGAAHLEFGHGPHFCLGAAFARAQTAVAVEALLRRSPGLALAVPADEVAYLPDPGTWRLAALPVLL